MLGEEGGSRVSIGRNSEPYRYFQCAASRENSNLNAGLAGRSSGSQLRSFGSQTGKENDSELSCFGHNGCKLRWDMHLALCPLDASGLDEQLRYGGTSSWTAAGTQLEWLTVVSLGPDIPCDDV
eukprot:scaffold167681_cov20-Cyclotella_meneghiniana.AAC.1